MRRSDNHTSAWLSRWYWFAIGLALFLAGACYWQYKHGLVRHVDVYDGFEGRQLSKIWETSRFVPGAVTMQPAVVRAGRSAARVVLHTHDIFEPGINGDKDSERAELLEASRLVSKEDLLYEYSFSIFVPPDFPIVPTRLILAQWKQDCDGNANCGNDSPVVAVRYVSGVFHITHQTGRNRTTLFETNEDIRGRWTDLKFQLRFSTNESGRIKAWMNGRQTVDYTGVNAYPENATTGYASPSRFYFKTGLYRDVMTEPMTVFIDEYRKKQLPE